MGCRNGFSRLELLLVVLLLAVVSGIAVPNYLELARSTRAQQAIADLYAVRAAAYLCYGDTAAWPPEAPTGVAPPELASRITGSLEFAGEHYRLDWENWTGARPDTAEGTVPIVIGVSVVSADPRLLQDVHSILSRSDCVRSTPSKVTLRIAGPDGI
jgi:type II secretory pathway pseudopilin PulG